MNNTLAALRQRWLALSERERQLLSLMALTVGLLLVWLIAVRPAWRTLREVPAKAAVLEAEWLTMQRLASESKGLKGQPSVSLAQASQALKTATEPLGDKAQLAIVADRATLTVSGISPEQLRQWLVQTRQAARARPTELQVTRDEEGLSGRLVVTLGIAS